MDLVWIPMGTNHFSKTALRRWKKYSADRVLHGIKSFLLIQMGVIKLSWLFFERPHLLEIEAEVLIGEMAYCLEFVLEYSVQKKV